MKPKIGIFTFRARCPNCGWVLPLLHKESRRLRQAFPCPDCGTSIRLTRFWSLINPVVMALTVPFLAWVSFSETGREQGWELTLLLIFLIVLHYWFETLELATSDEPSDTEEGR